jgi:F-type H+-transporting ATPase subunit b
MDSLIEVFHIDAKLLIAQAVNFAIVFFVLYRFALKPLAEVMRERTAKIEKGLEDAKSAAASLSDAKSEYERILSEAKKEASAIIESARDESEKRRQAEVAKTKEEIGAIVSQGKAKLASDKSEMLVEIKAEIADLVAAAAEKVLGEVMDPAKDRELIKRAAKAGRS